MHGEPALELSVHRAGFWLLHTNHVAFWVLAALASALLVARILLLLRLEARSPAALALPGRPRLLALAAVFAASSAVTGYLAVRPDPEFYRTIASASMISGDNARAAAYLETLLWWGHGDVRRDLAACYLRLARPGAAFAMAEEALALGAGPEGDLRLLAASGRLGAGDRPGAVRHLERAAALEPDGPRRRAILDRVEELRRGDGAK